MDPLASNLPMAVQNSKCNSPDELNVNAGEAIAFELEIRTTDPSLRSNRWFANLA